MKVMFLQWHCDTRWSVYREGSATSLQLVSSGENPACHPGEPVATATVNLVHPLNPDQITVKDYSENVGMLQALIDAGVVEPAYRLVGMCRTRIALCQLTLTAQQEIVAQRTSLHRASAPVAEQVS